VGYHHLVSRTSLACSSLLLLSLLQGCDTGFREQPDAGIRPDAADSGAADAAVDAGDSGWTLVYTDPQAAAGESLNAIWVADKDNVFAVGDNGQSVWLEQGTWLDLNKSKGLDLYGVWGRSAKEVYAVGRYELDGAPVVSRYDGNSWTTQGPIPAHVTALSDAWGPGDTQVYYTGLEGQIFQHDPVNHPTTPYHLAAKTGGCPQISDPGPILWAIDGSGLDNIIAAGDSGLLAHRDANGWMRLCHPDSKVAYRAVFSAPGSTDFYLGANYLGLWRFTGRATATLKIHEDRGTKGADKRHLWSIWGTSAAAILAVGDAGTILYFDGTGAGARVLPSPTSGALFGVSGADGKNVYICGEGNRIWRGELPTD
jgi:hypothetical protein